MRLFPTVITAIGLVFIPATSFASVSINLKTGQAFYVNDDDAGYYVNDGTQSKRVVENDVFKMPISGDGKLRWDICRELPCTRIPEPARPPGERGKKLLAKLTPAEIEFNSLLKSERKVSPQETALREAMLKTASRLDSVSLRTLSEAFQPVTDAIAIAQAASSKIPLLPNALKAVALKQYLMGFWQERIDKTSYGRYGSKSISCEVLRQGAQGFNAIAGYAAVVTTGIQEDVGLFGATGSCSPDSGLERQMLNTIQVFLKEEITSQESGDNVKQTLIMPSGEYGYFQQLIQNKLKNSDSF